MISGHWVRRREANEVAGMPPCSGREGRGAEVSDWREEGRLSIGRGVSVVQEVVERGRQDKEGGSSDIHREWHKNLGTVLRLQARASTPLPGGGADAQKSANMYQSDNLYPRTQDQA